MSPRKVLGGAVPQEMEPTIKEAEKKGMERLGWAQSNDWKDSVHTDDVPDWIEVPNRFGLSGSRGEYSKIDGDSWVYWLISNGGSRALVYRQLKSDYYETTPKKGTCPNCQSYIKRYDGDDYLTCHRCGWQYKPLKERIKNLF
ncbi:Rcat domain-containing protein [Halostella salina]|uniref:IBR domain-containing protein n=1 Tax=Halostella salina TaxID=1547897 RepID=UPI0013CEF71F|nr:IBR domain-containing protein [Halostella salina]